jgi:hypothetical protein
VWNWTVYFWGSAKCVELDCIVLGEGKFCGNIPYNFGRVGMCGTGLYRFGGRAYYVEMYCISLGRRKMCGTGLYIFGGQIV